MMLDRALERGRRAVILDPKGEYAAFGAVFRPSTWSRSDATAGAAPSRRTIARVATCCARLVAQRSRCLAEKAINTTSSMKCGQQLDSPRPRRILRALFELLREHLGIA